MNLIKIIEALEKSNYTCIAGNLENGVPFIELKKKANTQKICCLGTNHPCRLNVNDSFCLAAECQYQVIELT